MTLSVHLASVIARLSAQRARVLVGIDGPDAAGKTTLADDLACHLGVPCLRASIDGFHRPRMARVRRGALSPAGYFHDSFDYHLLTEELIVPFLEGGRSVRARAYDWAVDAPVQDEPTPVPERAVLVFDGVFLLRSELRHFWDYSVYLRVAPQIVLERAIRRDAGEGGWSDEVRRRYEARYLPGQALYREESDPERHADVVVNNSDFSNPIIVRQSTGGS